MLAEIRVHFENRVRGGGLGGGLCVGRDIGAAGAFSLVFRHVCGRLRVQWLDAGNCERELA
jgi:hypothetical protein